MVMETRPAALCVPLIVAGATAACLDKAPVPTGPVDTSAPVIQVLSPTPQSYDDDGDKLVDVRIGWDDSGGKVLLANVTLKSLDGLNGTASTSDNLLGYWRVERLDDSGLVVHETVAQLLHPGLNRIELSVPDTAGNVRLDTVTFTLPFGAFVKTIATGLQLFDFPALGVTICPDDGRLYMTANRNLVIVDPDSLRVLAIVRNQYAFDAMYQPLCVAGDPILYVTSTVERFDRPTMTWLPRVTGSFVSDGIAQSRADPNVLYAGELDGIIGLIDRAQGQRTGYLLTIKSQTVGISDIVALDGDAKLYATLTDSGVLAIDPRKDSVLKLIPVVEPGLPGPGNSQSLVLTPDGRRVYATVDYGLPRGVVEIDTQLDSVVRRLPLFNYYCIDLALSPDERRMFVTTQDNGSPSENVLIDVPGWRVLQTFPRPRTPSETRFDRDIVFHPSGKLIFVTHNLDLDVYLNRE
jgi:DNA-binding beta-propeller fold protein YncE